MKNILFYILSAITLTAYSQHEQHILRGKIYEVDTSGNKNALEYVNVYWLEDHSGVITDDNGEFSIHIPHDDKAERELIISYIGYKPDTIIVTNDLHDIEVLMDASRLLDEVEIRKRRGTVINSKINIMPSQVITQAGLHKLACCNIGESFESNATIDAGYTDAVSGAKKIRMLGLDGIYSQMLFENIPFLRGMESGFGLNHIPGPFMESIQISKGTSSVVNGYESTSGQINVEYKKPDASDLLFLNLFANTEGRYESNVTSALRINDKWGTMLFFHGSLNNLGLDHNKDGFYDLPLNKLYNFMNRWEYKFGEGAHLQFGLEVLDEKRIGGELDFQGKKDSDPGLYGIDISLKKMRVFSKIGYVVPEKPYNNIGWINSYTNYSQNSLFGLREHRGNQNSIFSNFIYQTILGNTNHQLNSGLTFQYDDYAEYFIDRDYDRREVVSGLFTQYTYTYPEKLVFMTGLRIDYNSRYKTLITPRIHVKYDINEHYTVRGSFGKSYRSANVFNENLSLLASSRIFYFTENFDLESAWNGGFSVIRHFHFPGQRDGSLTIDIFRTSFQNQVIIDTDVDISGVHIYNLNGKSYSNAIQAEFNGEIINGLELTLAYRFNDVKVQQIQGLKEKPFVVKNKGLFTTTYTLPSEKWKADLTIQYNGSARISDTSGNPEEYRMSSRSPVYFIVHSQVTYRYKWLDIYAGVENLTGYRQKDAIINADNPFGEYFDATLIWGPLTGRMFYGGIRIKFPNIFI